MSDQVTASAAGLRSAPDPRSRAYNSPNQKRPRKENDTSAESDQLSAKAFPPRYKDGTAPGESELDVAVSFSQTQAAFLGMVGTALDRMGELSALCQDASKSDGDRAKFTVEFTQLQNFISDIGAKKFNGVDLFAGQPPKVGNQTDGSYVPLNTISWNGANPERGMAIAYDAKSTEVTTDAGKGEALSNVRKALDNLGEMQAKVSANLRRLNLSGQQLLVLNQNLSAASHRINEIDWAKKLTDVARFRILGESGAAKSAQANTSPGAAIRLLEPKS